MAGAVSVYLVRRDGASYPKTIGRGGATVAAAVATTLVALVTLLG